jgi:hypothetical protein
VVTEPQPDGIGAWRLNPDTALPITVAGLDKDAALTLKGYLDASIGNGKLFVDTDDIVALLSAHAFAWRELDEYVQKYRPAYLDIVARRAPQMIGAPDEERKVQRELQLVKDDAVDDLDIRPCGDVAALLDGPPEDSPLCVPLVQRYSVRPLHVYLRYAARPGSTRRIPVDHFDRRHFDTLVSLGLAKAGPEVDISTILERLSLEQLNRLTVDVHPNSFSRKTAAIACFQGLDNQTVRLGRVVTVLPI